MSKPLNTCLSGCGRETRKRFAPGHDQRHLGQCLRRLSEGDLRGADELEQQNPGHAQNYDMACLRRGVGQTSKELAQCRRPGHGAR